MEHAAESTRQSGRAPGTGPAARVTRVPEPPIHPVLQLQRAVGNQAVLAMLRSGALQAKLRIGSPDDPSEREADQVSERVMRKTSGAGAVGACTCAAGGEICEECRKDPMIQRRAASGAAGMSDAPALVHQTLGDAGRPLDAAPRADMESRFGRDFGAVRIHTDRQAAESAKSIDALAYASGNHIAFGEGQYAPCSEAGGRLLAHELTHVLQQDGPQTLRRDTDPKASLIQPPANPAPAPPDPILHPWPTTGERVIFGGREVSESPDQLTNLAWNLVAFGCSELTPPIPPGEGAADEFAIHMQRVAFLWGGGTTPCPAPDDPSYEDCHRSEVFRKLVVPFSKVVETVYHACEDDLTRFQEQARQNALDILAANQQQAEAEMKAYGIKFEDVTYDAEFSEFPTSITVTQYSMDEKSAGASNLRTAAQLLLKRREAIYAKRDEQNDHMFVDPMSGYAAMDDQYENLGKEVESLEGEYNASRAILSTQFPLLAAFSELDPSAIKKGDSELRKLAETAPGQDMARLVGEKIHDTLKNIKKSRDGLDPKHDDVNVWTLDDIVKLTRVQLDVDADPVFKVLVDDKVKHEQPGILHDIALAVLNIVAILLAPETGGLSLVAAAGVNAAVAASHVEDYLTKKALAGSAFDGARALSKDDPSLFWLAFEIVGTVFDVGAAAHAVSTFRSLASLTKVAIAAKEGKEAAAALEELRFAAEKEGPALVEKVTAKVAAARKGEASIKGFEEESKLLEEIGAETSAKANKAVEFVDEHPGIVEDADKPGHRHARVDSDHEIVEVEDSEGIHCEYHSPGGPEVHCPLGWGANSEAAEAAQGSELEDALADELGVNTRRGRPPGPEPSGRTSGLIGEGREQVAAGARQKAPDYAKYISKATRQDLRESFIKAYARKDRGAIRNFFRGLNAPEQGLAEVELAAPYGKGLTRRYDRVFMDGDAVVLVEAKYHRVTALEFSQRFEQQVMNDQFFLENFDGVRMEIFLDGNVSASTMERIEDLAKTFGERYRIRRGPDFKIEP